MRNYAKRRARYLLAQALYQWQMVGTDKAELIAHFLDGVSANKIDTDYFEQTLRGVLKHQSNIDQTLMPVCDRPLAEVNPVELAILRIGVYELLYCLEMPYKVIIKESLLTAKRFGSNEGHRYVNGVLDQVGHRVRAAEIED